MSTPLAFGSLHFGDYLQCFRNVSRSPPCINHVSMKLIRCDRNSCRLFQDGVRILLICRYEGIRAVCKMLRAVQGFHTRCFFSCTISHVRVKVVFDLPIQHNNKFVFNISELMDVLLACMDKSKGDHPNSLAEGLPLLSCLIRCNP